MTKAQYETNSFIPRSKNLGFNLKQKSNNAELISLLFAILPIRKCLNDYIKGKSRVVVHYLSWRVFPLVFIVGSETLHCHLNERPIYVGQKWGIWVINCFCFFFLFICLKC